VVEPVLPPPLAVEATTIVDQPWPALPDAVPADDPAAEYGAIIRRAWERQRRLDREQRGDEWNA
jgi:hypothetical protein